MRCHGRLRTAPSTPNEPCQEIHPDFTASTASWRKGGGTQSEMQPCQATPSFHLTSAPSRSEPSTSRNPEGGVLAAEAIMPPCDRRRADQGHDSGATTAKSIRSNQHPSRSAASAGAVGRRSLGMCSRPPGIRGPSFDSESETETGARRTGCLETEGSEIVSVNGRLHTLSSCAPGPVQANGWGAPGPSHTLCEDGQSRAMLAPASGLFRQNGHLG